MHDRAVHDRSVRSAAARDNRRQPAERDASPAQASELSADEQAAMNDFDPLRERNDETAGRKLGLFALAGTLGVAAIIAFGVVAGGSEEREQPAELDPLAQLALTGADPKAPVSLSASTASGAASAAFGRGNGKQPATVQLDRLSFPATLVGDESAIEATVRAAEAEHASIVSRPRARGSDIPAGALAGGESERLARAAKHDPLVAQAFLSSRAEPRTATPERGPVAPSGSEGAFTLQVVSYDTRDTAERFATALRARGHRAFVALAELPGRGRSYRVRVGPFTTRRDALAYQTSFERGESMHSVLVASSGK